MRRMLVPIAVLLAAASLASCGGGMMATSSSVPLAWVRTDGQSGRANPALVDQFASDKAACGIAAAGDNGSLQAAQPCMNKRGYALVPAGEAETTAARYRAQNAASYSKG